MANANFRRFTPDISCPETFVKEASTTYARLYAEDLKALGKEAALCFLETDTPLNDAVVKVAQRHPDISTHQIRRIVEFANQETFARLFEKQAGDKNIEFQIADPAEVLHRVNSGVRPMCVVDTPSDYCEFPVKMSSSVLGDIELAKAFGLELSSPAMKKVAHIDSQPAPSVADRILRTTEPLPDNPVDRIIKLSQLVPGMAGPEEMGPPAQNDASSADEHHQQMLEVQREIELAKKREELAKIQQKAQQAASPEMGDPQAQEAMPQEAQQQAAMAAPPPQPMPAQEEEPQIPAPSAGPIVNPPGGAIPKTASLMREASLYAKKGRPLSQKVLEDLAKAASVSSIREALSKKEQSYPEANPHRELVDCWHKVGHLREEAVSASHKNGHMLKEARASFYHHVEQFLHDGGNLGEVLHAMEKISSDESFLHKSACELAIHLASRGFDMDRARGAMIHYEMSKSASSRSIDLDNPLNGSFAAMCKLYSNQPLLDKTAADLSAAQKQLERQIRASWRA